MRASTEPGTMEVSAAGAPQAKTRSSRRIEALVFMANGHVGKLTGSGKQGVRKDHRTTGPRDHRTPERRSRNQRSDRDTKGRSNRPGDYGRDPGPRMEHGLNTERESALMALEKGEVTWSGGPVVR